MASDMLARRYAEAYFQLAKEAGTMKEWGDELARAVEMLEHPAVAEAVRKPLVSQADRVRPELERLPTPGVPRAARVGLVMALRAGRAQPVRNLVRLLVERGRSSILG